MKACDVDDMRVKSQKELGSDQGRGMFVFNSTRIQLHSHDLCFVYLRACLGACVRASSFLVLLSLCTQCTHTILLTATSSLRIFC